MKNKKNIPLLVAAVILLIAVVIYFTIFNKGDNNNGGNNRKSFDVNNLYNMVPYVQRANDGLYVYGNLTIKERSTEDLVIGALNHYEYVNCNSEETKNNCDTIEADKIISEVKEIYGVDLTKDEIEKVNTKDDYGICFYIYANGLAFQSYNYKDGVFSVNGEKGFINKNNKIYKYEEKDNEYKIYEKIHYIGISYENDSIYEVLYSGSDYSKEVTREKLNEGEYSKIDLSKYDEYGTTYIHTFKKNSDGKYQYYSSFVEGLTTENVENVSQ